MNRKEYLKLLRKEKEEGRKEGEKYRSNLKGNKPFNTLDFKHERTRFLYLRKSAYFSVKKFAEGKGFKLNKAIFEESFQDSFIQHLENKNKGLNWLKSIPTSDGKGLPLQAILNKNARQFYMKAISKQGDSLESLLEAITEGKENINTIAFYQFKQHNTAIENYLFFDSLKSELPELTYRLARLYLAGYNGIEASKLLKVHEKTVRKHTKKLKSFLAFGIAHF